MRLRRPNLHPWVAAVLLGTCIAVFVVICGIPMLWIWLTEFKRKYLWPKVNVWVPFFAWHPVPLCGEMSPFSDNFRRWVWLEDVMVCYPYDGSRLRYTRLEELDNLKAAIERRRT